MEIMAKIDFIPRLDNCSYTVFRTIKSEISNK